MSYKLCYFCECELVRTDSAYATHNGRINKEGEFKSRVRTHWFRLTCNDCETVLEDMLDNMSAERRRRDKRKGVDLMSIHTLVDNMCCDESFRVGIELLISNSE